MKTRFWNSIMGIGAAAIALALAQAAVAQCGLPNKPIKPMSWHPLFGGPTPSLVRTGFDDNLDGPSIVGMWHVVFTALTQNGETIPVQGGVVIDNSIVVWHPDGTEIMNSSRSAQDGNFCLGVWKRTGERTYLLNHIPWQGNAFDPTAPPDTIGPPQGGAQIIEKIILSRNGDSYSGTFTLHAYNTDGSLNTSFTGTLSAKRITPETPFSELM